MVFNVGNILLPLHIISALVIFLSSIFQFFHKMPLNLSGLPSPISMES